MTTRKLDKTQWRTFFDRLSTTLEGKQAEIEIASLRLGDQVEADWLPLLGIAYDPNDDIVEVALEGLDHLIPKPRELYAEEGPGGLTALEIIDADDVKQIVKLRDPLRLPAPSQARAERGSSSVGVGAWRGVARVIIYQRRPTDNGPNGSFHSHT